WRLSSPRGVGKPGLSRSGTEAEASANENPARALFSEVEQPGQRSARRGDSQMARAGVVEAAPPPGPCDEAELDQERLDHVLDRIARFGESGSQCYHYDRAAFIGVGDHRQIAAVRRI